MLAPRPGAAAFWSLIVGCSSQISTNGFVEVDDASALVGHEDHDVDRAPRERLHREGYLSGTEPSILARIRDPVRRVPAS